VFSTITIISIARYTGNYLILRDINTFEIMKKEFFEHGNSWYSCFVRQKEAFHSSIGKYVVFSRLGAISHSLQESK